VDTRLGELALFQSGEPVLKSPKSGAYTVTDNNNDQAEIKCSFDNEGVPFVTINGDPAELVVKVSALQWAWTGFPLILVFLGGAVGGMLGGAAAYLNFRLMKSGASAGLKYFLSGIVTLAAFGVWLGVTALLQFFLNPEVRGSLFGGAAAPVKTEAGQPAAPVKTERPNLYIDNGSDKRLSFSLDGGAKTVLEPYSVLPLAVRGEKHKAEIYDGAALYDKAELVIPFGQAVVWNPRGLCGYVIETATYSSLNNSFGGGGIGNRAVAGETVVTADFGPAEAFPKNISVRVRKGQIAGDSSRTKISKTLPKNIPRELAFKTLSDKASAGVWFDGGSERFNIALLDALGQGPQKQEIMDLLLKTALGEKSPSVLNAALKSLKTYEADIPDSKLLEMISAPDCARGGLRSGEPAANGRAGWAAGILLARGKLDLISERFQTLPEPAADRMLAAALDAPPEARRAIAAAALSTPPKGKYARTPILTLVCSPGYIPDAAGLKAVDEYIAGMPWQDSKRHWENCWREKLLSLALSENPEFSPELRNSLTANIFNAGDDAEPMRRLAVELARKGRYGILAANYAKLPSAVKAAILYNLPQKQNVKEIPAEAAELAWLAAAEPEESLWRQALGWLCYNSPEPMKTLERAWASERSAPETVRKKFDELLFSSMSGRLRDMSSADHTSVAVSAPSARWVKAALSELLRDSEKRAGSIEALTTALKGSVSPENKLLIMRTAAESFHRNYGDDRVTAAAREFLQTGLSAENTPEVRAAALEGAMKLQDNWPDDKLVSDIISVQSGQKKTELETLAGARTVETLKKQLHDNAAKAAALEKLTAMAARSDNEKTASEAARTLPRIAADDRNFKTILEMASDGKFPVCRLEALRRISWTSAAGKQTSIFLRALDDSDPAVREFAFDFLAGQSAGAKSSSAITQKLKAAAEKEPDPKTAERMMKKTQRLK
jgi:hypothetical protein